MSFHRSCQTCGLPVPGPTTRRDPFTVPCSIYHIRCLRCGWPVAKCFMEEDEVCITCKGYKK